MDTPASGPDQWRVETEPPAGPSRFGFFYGALDTGKNKLSRRAAFSSSSFMDTAVKLTGQVDRGTHRIGLHTPRLSAGDLNKSITPDCRVFV
jgi:hypothetical protein